ncbi:Alpha/beta fold hydrolase [Hyphomicrobiales bacterium]|nr:Alpha/beta fold hydrolase [Hyphomicrobiales bacterium]CAH1700722.1 Alpha/beta fold hydrolase [Hyphomicrobiales bacterium]CAI0344595.1 Alpha/beta fold hydrolase [Hyphomicrobiales bacterium]
MIGMAMRLRGVVLALLLPLALLACATPRTLELSQAPAADVAGTVEIYVATTRQPSPQPVYFTGERSTKLSFARLDITVPRAHKAGELELPSSGPGDPAKHFTATYLQRLDLAPVIADVRKELLRRPANQRDVLVFVHGYNTNFADAVYRFAQIVYDSGFKGVPVLFSWPSRGELLAYPYDRESAYYSRDFLEANLRGIARDLGSARMDILAHSMGTLLTLETLRQAAIRGDGAFGGKLRDVMLAAPDVDLDVFKTQMVQIRRPVTVFVSADDRALSFSRRFAGDKTRLGAVSAKDTEIIAELDKLGAQIIDISAVSSADSLNHGKFASSPRVVQLIGARLQQDKGIGFAGPQLGDRLGDIAGGVAGTVGSTVGLVVAAPVTILSGGQ